MPTRLSVGLQTKSAYMFAGWLIHKECLHVCRLANTQRVPYTFAGWPTYTRVPTSLYVGLHAMNVSTCVGLPHKECLHVCRLAYTQRVPTSLYVGLHTMNVSMCVGWPHKECLHVAVRLMHSRPKFTVQLPPGSVKDKSVTNR